MRLLLALLAAQALAIAAADAGWLPAPVALRSALVAAGVALLARRPAAARGAACIALAGASAAGLALRLEQAAPAPAAPLEATIEARVAAVQPRAGGAQLELAGVRAVAPEGAAAPPRLLLRAGRAAGAAPDPLGAASPGDRLRARVRIRRLETRANPGGADRAREAARRGIGATATLVHPDLLVRRPDAEGWRPLAPVHRLRARVAARLAREGEGGALLAALGVGERAGLGAGSRDAFRRLGVSHLLSISGLHLAMAAALVFRALAFALLRVGPARARLDPRGPALAAAALAAGAYALLAGFGVPVRRALVLLVGLALERTARRPTPRGAPLAAAAVLVLAFEPAALFDVGARLSFAASAALVWAARTPRDPAAPWTLRARLRGALAGALGATAVAGAATAPLAAGTLGTAAPGWALAANAVAIPWTGAVLMPAAFAASLAAALAPDAAATDALCRAAAALASGTLAALAKVAARAPLALPAPVAPGVLIAALALALLAVRARTGAQRLAAALAVGALLRLAPPPAVAPAPPRVVVLDVGQGDAVLVQGRTGALLVDAGVAVPDGADLGATVVVPALRALGVRRLDLLVASHGDLDHRGGLPAVLRALPVSRVWLPHGGIADPAFAEIVAAAASAGAVVEEQGAGRAALRAGDLAVEPLWPPRAGGGGASRNDRSLALRVEVANRRVLLPGDLEAEAERQLLASGAPLRADVLKLGHHGSRTSSTAAWLAAVGGEVGIVSAPRQGRFGMPHREVVARARRAGYALWWTGRDGAVLIGLEPVLHVRGWRRRKPERGGAAAARASGAPAARSPVEPRRGRLASVVARGAAPPGVRREVPGPAAARRPWDAAAGRVAGKLARLVQRPKARAASRPPLPRPARYRVGAAPREETDMRQHFHRCGHLRILAVDASDRSRDRKGGTAILEELCEARRLARCVGLAECDVLTPAQKRDLLVARATRLRAEEGGVSFLADVPDRRAAELRSLRGDLLEEYERIVEGNRRRKLEAAAALQRNPRPIPAGEEGDLAGAGISVIEDVPLRELRTARLDTIERALDAMKRGRYGDCARCEGPIEIERLHEAPDTRLCRACVREALPDVLAPAWAEPEPASELE